MSYVNRSFGVVAFLVAFGASLTAIADIYEWEYVNPDNPELGRQQSATLVPDGAGADAAPGVSLRNLDLTKAYLAGANLTGADSYFATLTEAYLSNANLSNTIFYQAKLINAYLQHAILNGAHLGDTILTGADLIGAEVRGADFSNSTLAASQLYATASYQNQDLTGIRLGRNDARNWDFSGQNLTNASFALSRLAGADLTGANISGATFRRTTSGGFTAAQLYSTASYHNQNLAHIGLDQNALHGWNLAGQNLTSAIFRFSSLTDAILAGADVRGADFTHANGLTAAQLYSTVSYQNQDLSGIKLSNVGLTEWNFAGQKLENADFSHALLHETDFKQANLSGAFFFRAVLANTDLREAALKDAYFSESEMVGANLTAADIRGADFRSTTIGGFTTTQLYSTASYQNQDLSGIGLRENDLTGWNFAGQNLSNADFNKSTLTDANLTGAIVRGADFYSTTVGGFTALQLYSTASYQNQDLSGIGLGMNDLTGWNFVEQNLSNANFHQSTLTHTDLTGADVRGTNFGNATLTDANLTGADVRGAVFGSAYDGALTATQLYSTASYVDRDLTGIGLSGIDLSSVNLSDQNLTRAGFVGSILIGADFRRANLSNVSFSSIRGGIADLTGADLRGALNADLSSAVVTNVIQQDGSISGLDLTNGQTLLIRNFDDSTSAEITVEEELVMDSSGVLELRFEADTWGSVISFAPGIPVVLGGTLKLDFAPDVNLLSQLGRTIDVFNWSGVSPSALITVDSPYVWDLSHLYSTGEVTLTEVASLPGDFNHDGAVDTADYIVWRDGLGAATYTQADYTAWRNNFGADHNNGKISTTVPEPSTALYFAYLFAAVVFPKKPVPD